jgi:hypothetical protein
MSWSDLADTRSQLKDALSSYDWVRATTICESLIRQVHKEREPCPSGAAQDILAALRKKRRFDLMTRVAETFIRSGQNAPRIRRQYAQALIDQGILVAPEFVLQTLAMEPLDGDSQVVEAQGLLGRIYKQLYVNADKPASAYARVFLERALTYYLQTYRLDPKKNLWHGINVVALLHRAKADNIDVQTAPDPDELARRVLSSLPAPAAAKDAFDLATRLEACLALGLHTDAETAALAYSLDTDADSFEVASTLRQFEEVWRLRDEKTPGSTILPILRAAKLRAEGGAVHTTPKDVKEEVAVVRHAIRKLERNFGDDRIVTLRWYETGLLRTRSVARVERLSGKGHGTGWLVRSEDFFLSRPPEVLLLTNAHVVNLDGTDEALAPNQAQANFQGLGSILEFHPTVVWSSPPDKLDTTFLRFKKDPPKADPMPIFEGAVRLTTPPSRLYVIGHPGGRDLELSLHDNHLLGCNDRLLHYRTPTEAGSSGSPVFEADGWRVVGLHHSGGLFERLDGKQPPYEANEGIAIRAIRNEPKP